MKLETRATEIVIIGGGAAGLSAAVTLARARRSVLVIDAGHPRNAPAAHAHGFLGHDGIDPAELLARGRREAIGYGARIVPGTAVAADPLPGGGFLVHRDDGSTVRAERLLVATGLVDELPGVPGLAARWGRDVLHCPYCHGWEVRDLPLAVLATGPLAVRQALLWRQWSERVTLLAHTWRVPDADRATLAARGIEVAEGEVTGLTRTDDDRLAGVALAGGGSVVCRALIVAPRFLARSGVLSALGLRAVREERDGHDIGTRVEAGPGGATALPGVWVAGNVTSPMDNVVAAAAQGARAAIEINGDLVEAEARAAEAGVG
ncbi:NAD(P)/FAD-dependent oxidoreductase [Streptomyces sp. G-G2]|uniref:NAD(P)/FAD-dependent oxidoreductase n=1 Tax=Streptomyces sp. G-G2 TaxID=3046201 RepID=UPI0024B89CED|nr:NAD(P)/FAD-dependent oxidoreductase [Streptomyces sp. G-G2]MDJ0382683.1 NAD(P)/FAD-dependent oxidoreductase [Streptomyces sp. G-G2]